MTAAETDPNRRERMGPMWTRSSATRRTDRVGLSMSLTVSLDDETVVIAVHGDVDCATCNKLRHVIHGILATGVDSIVLDCTDLKFMDSSGLGVVAETVRHLQGRGGSLTLCNTNDTIRRLFTITGVEALVTLA